MEILDIHLQAQEFAVQFVHVSVSLPGLGSQKNKSINYEWLRKHLLSFTEQVDRAAEFAGNSFIAPLLLLLILGNIYTGSICEVSECLALFRQLLIYIN